METLSLSASQQCSSRKGVLSTIYMTSKCQLERCSPFHNTGIKRDPHSKARYCVSQLTIQQRMEDSTKEENTARWDNLYNASSGSVLTAFVLPQRAEVQHLLSHFIPIRREGIERTADETSVTPQTVFSFSGSSCMRLMQNNGAGLAMSRL